MAKATTGNWELNDFLDGGYEEAVITTLYGPAGSGKTNLCMLACVSMAKKGKKVIFIDTEGGFSVDRLNQLTDKKVMDKIVLLKATTFTEQNEIFNKLAERVKESIGLIVVDSVAMLYRLELGISRNSQDQKRVNDINRDMSKQLRTLNEISRNKNIPVIITNQVYSDFSKSGDLEERKVHMVGGDIMKYWSKCIMELQIHGNKRKAILRKHRSLPEKEFVFTITGTGIEKEGIKAKSWFRK